MIENNLGCKISTLRSDNGGEHCSTSFVDILKCNGIRHERTILGTPEQNGVSDKLKSHFSRTRSLNAK